MISADNARKCVERMKRIIEEKEEQSITDYEAWALLDEMLEYINGTERNPVIICPHCGKRIL